jgi:hypothetical protein
VAAQAAGRGERQGGDAVPGSELDQFSGVRADLLLGRGRQAYGLVQHRSHGGVDLHRK